MLLDVASITPDRILLLDAFFSIVIFHGSTIAAWRKQGFHQQPAYESFKALLEVRLWYFRHVPSAYVSAELLLVEQ